MLFDACDEIPVRPRRLPHRPALPNSRAMVGGLLIALAVLAAFAATSRADAPPGTRYVVAGRAITPGAVVQPDDLTAVALDLPADTAARAFRDLGDVVGAIAVAPLASGELLQQSTVVRASAAEPTADLSFAVDTDRAVNGELVPGDRIDVLATYGTGGDAFTLSVVRAALVTAADPADSVFGDSATSVVLTVSLTERDDVMALAHALRAAEVTVVRTTGLDDQPAGPDRYTPAP